MSATETAAKKLSRRYSNLGGVSALPWEQIIQAIMAMLGGCTTKEAKTFGKNHPLALKFLIRGKLRTDAGLRGDELDDAANAAVDVFNSSSVATIDAVRDEMDV